jgi:hypothetical protein
MVASQSPAKTNLNQTAARKEDDDAPNWWSKLGLPPTLDSTFLIRVTCCIRDEQKHMAAPRYLYAPDLFPICYNRKKDVNNTERRRAV